ncbi:hypothetical protein [Moorena sp. SIO4G3]|uniref:hypothetical protein n=1 Tax=Moorena sp. SIO4G3 TaxID=2607821 RepID=UPI00142A07BF|nr:hypothetical protein [Moorena sp. SIO4G3]NEO76412.1 hypothetical protein [Moorena sp. SIO4G3]
MRYTLFFTSCPPPLLRARGDSFCILPINCSLLPAPCSLKPRDLYLMSIISARNA